MSKKLMGVFLMSSFLQLSAYCQGRNAPCDDNTPPRPIMDSFVPNPLDTGADAGPCGPFVLQHHSPGGVVSARALAHTPPPKARKQFDRGVHAWHKGHIKEAVLYLNGAIRLDQNFVEARSELAAIYIKEGQFSLALEHLDSALALDPESAALNRNKASVWIALNRPVQAEESAKRALQFDPGSIEAHYLLGIAILMQDRLTPEALAHLSIAADKYPLARKYLNAAQAVLAAHSKTETRP